MDAEGREALPEVGRARRGGRPRPSAAWRRSSPRMAPPRTAGPRWRPVAARSRRTASAWSPARRDARGLAHEALEAVAVDPHLDRRIDAIGLVAEDDDRPVAERGTQGPAQEGHGHVQAVARGGGRRARPERLEQHVPRDRPAAVGDQVLEHQPRAAGRVDGHRPGLDARDAEAADLDDGQVGGRAAARDARHAGAAGRCGRAAARGRRRRRRRARRPRRVRCSSSQARHTVTAATVAPSAPGCHRSSSTLHPLVTA